MKPEVWKCVILKTAETAAAYYKGDMNMNKVSKPGVYSGYSEALYDGWKRFSEYVTMRDGVRIAVDYYRPTKNGITEENPLPVVWIFTPYDYRTVFATGRYSLC